MITANDIIETMLSMENEKQRQVLSRFFKTGKGEYGEGDQFLGLKVPQTRMVVKAARLQVALPEISKLLHSKWHEVRLCGFLLLVEEMKEALPKRRHPGRPELRAALVEFFLRHACQANNWDLVDLVRKHPWRLPASSPSQWFAAQPHHSRYACRKFQPLGAAHFHRVDDCPHPAKPVC